ncbi:beta-glucosidase [Burkholderia metallica]|nr:beta-glucosidase [Burkholderia metallica]
MSCSSAPTSQHADERVDRRANSLLSKMTLDEKIQMVHGAGAHTSPLGGAGYIPGISRLGIPDLNSANSTSGVNAEHAKSTALPAPLALSATWDPALAYEYGALIGRELRAQGFAEGLGGGVNLARNPRQGRTFEFFGEDPVLAGNMAAAMTNGTQAQNVVGTIKHLAMNNQETNRFTSNSIVDERTMRELELLAFQIAIEQSDPGNVMCAYNLVNGSKACENKYLITDVLKNEWHFKGIVQSDWYLAVSDTVRAANAGLDEEQSGSKDDAVGVLGFPTHFNQRLKAAIALGTVSKTRLDDMVFRKLRTLYRFDLIDNPPKPGGAIDLAAGRALSLKTAQESIVLLKNDTRGSGPEPVLPLGPKVRKLVVIGGHADVAVISGGGSGHVPGPDANAVNCRTPGAKADAMRTEPACAQWYKSSPLEALKAELPGTQVTFFDGNDAAAAAYAAAQADVAIVFATQWTTEALDLKSLSLPDGKADAANQTYDQNALIAAVAAKAKRTVVVLETGTAVTMPWLDNVDAVLEAWYPGEQGGEAIASVLAGRVSPSGKLTLTFPTSDRDLAAPPAEDVDLNLKTIHDARYTEGLAMGYRWYAGKHIKPLFPFGFGMSYTQFSYSGLQWHDDGHALTAVFTISNTGKRSGSDVAQLYVRLPDTTGEPWKRLVGWKRVSLAAGESKQVEITVPRQRLAIWDAANHGWSVPTGRYDVVVGPSYSEDALADSFAIH